MRAVWPCQGSTADGSPPWARSSRTASAEPVLAQVMTGVSPVPRGRFGSAPAASSRETVAAAPFSHARPSGVTP